MLEPFRAIIDGDEPPPPGSRSPDAEELIRALQVMLKAQVIYADTPGIGRAYELARHYAPFFTDYFACLGYALNVAHRDQMVSLSPAADAPRYDIAGERLRKDVSAYKLPREVLFARKEELPFTDSGKIDKRKLAAWMESKLRGGG